MLYIAVIVFLLVTIGVAALAFVNMPHDVTLSFIFGQTQPLPVGLLLLLAFLLGALMLYLITVSAAVEDRRAIKRLRARVVELEQAAPARQTTPPEQSPPVSLPPSPPPSAPVVPMPGMPGTDISDMPTLH
jgi:uncharacterized integral membrane protein